MLAHAREVTRIVVGPGVGLYRFFGGSLADRIIARSGAIDVVTGSAESSEQPSTEVSLGAAGPSGYLRATARRRRHPGVLAGVPVFASA